MNRIYGTKITNNYLATKEAEITKLSEFNDPIYQSINQECKAGEKKLDSLPANHPLRDNIQVKLFGTFAQRNDNWQEKIFSRITYLPSTNPFKR